MGLKFGGFYIPGWCIIWLKKEQGNERHNGNIVEDGIIFRGTKYLISG